MYRLYTTKAILEQILLGEFSEDWQNALESGDISEICIPEEFAPEVDNMGGSDILTMWSNCAHIYGSDNFKENLINKKYDDFCRSVTKSSYTICLLDDSFNQEDVKDIENRTGILCHLASNFEACKLFDRSYLLPLEENENPVSWGNVFGNVILPTKNVIICDRYLFSREERMDATKDYKEAIENIESILDIVTASGYDGLHHATVIFDANEMGVAESYKLRRMEEIAQELQKYVYNKFLHRTQILLDLVSVERRTENYDITHDRYIFGDYFTVSATRSICAFLNNNSFRTQGLNRSTLFSSIDPIKKHSNDIKLRKNEFIGYNKMFNSNLAIKHYRIDADSTRFFDRYENRNGLLS